MLVASESNRKSLKQIEFIKVNLFLLPLIIVNESLGNIVMQS